VSKAELQGTISSLEAAMRAHKRDVDMRSSIVQQIAIVEKEKENQIRDANIKLKNVLNNRRGEYDLLHTRVNESERCIIGLKQQVCITSTCTIHGWMDRYSYRDAVSPSVDLIQTLFCFSGRSLTHAFLPVCLSRRFSLLKIVSSH
jgi:hypothetical protein